MEFQENVQATRKSVTLRKAIYLLYPVFAILALFIGDNIVRSEYTNVDERLKEQASQTAESYKEAFNAWLEDKKESAVKVSNNAIIHIYAKEAATIVQEGDGLNRKEAHLKLQNAIQNANWQGMVLLNENGRTLLKAGNFIEDNMGSSLYAQKAYGTQKIVLSPIVWHEGTPILTLYSPIPKEKARGVIAAQVNVISLLSSLFFSNTLNKGEKLHLFQNANGSTFMVKEDGEVLTWEKSEPLRPAFPQKWVGSQDKTSHSIKVTDPSTTGMRTKYTHVAGINRAEETPFSFLVSYDLETAYASLAQYRAQVHTISQLFALCLSIILMGAYWFRTNTLTSKELQDLREQAELLYEKEHMFESVNEAVKEHISVKTLGGTYTYANSAYKHFLGKTPHEIIGKKDKDLYNEIDAKILEELEKDALKTHLPVFKEIQLTVNGARKDIEISKTPLKDKVGRFTAIATVSRDITEVMASRKMHERVQKNVTEALLALMERYNPQAAKHTKQVNSFVMAVAKRMHMPEENMIVLDIASSLSQVGKIFPEAMGSNEDAFESTIQILDSINWHGLPVTQVVYQMYERLDGSGKPNGLSGQEIDPLARLLSVCDKFCELTLPKTGEGEPLTPERAIKHLHENSNRFDALYVGQLAECILDDAEVLLVS